MTDDSGNDRRRDIEGRIDTLGTGTNGASGRRAANRVGDRLKERRGDDEEAETAEASLADEEEPDEEAEEGDDAGASEQTEAGAENEPADEAAQFTTEEDDEPGEHADYDEELDDDAEFETRAEDVDERSSLEVELDPFVRAYAARRAAELGDESLDEYIVGSVKGYLAGLLGGEVSSPGTLKREVDIEADPIFGGLLESLTDEDETVEDVIVDAVAEASDVPVDEESLVVAGLRDHEALLNGVVANSSNDLDDVSEVVQAAVETRLIEEPA
jgi:hypothetical protein